MSNTVQQQQQSNNRFENNNNMAYQQHTISSPPVFSQPPKQQSVTSFMASSVVRGELDEQSGYAIIDYIDEVDGKLDVSEQDMREFYEKRRREGAQKPVNHALNRSQFYIPDAGIKSTGSRSNNGILANFGLVGGGREDRSLLDNMVGTLSARHNLKTLGNVKLINKNVLLYNGITVEILVRHCRVPITNMHLANILVTFDDLVEIGFKPTDLLIDRTLFGHNTLTQVFKTYHRHMVEKQVEITLGDLMINNSFPSSELVALGFTLDALIESKALKRGQLQGLKFPASELVQLGLRRKHMGREYLNIDQKFATTPRQANGDGGLGWSRDDYDSVPS